MKEDITSQIAALEALVVGYALDLIGALAIRVVGRTEPTAA